METAAMKQARAEHEGRSLLIHEFVPDFTLEDVWALPVYGEADGFEEFLALLGSFDPSQAESRPARFLWGLRDRLGAWFDLGRISTPGEEAGEGELPIPGTSELSLRERVPAELGATAEGFDFGAPLPFDPLYRADREAAAEISNRTVHGVVHFSWIEVDAGKFQAWMAVYVKPRGAFGRAYMALIKPFRYWIVYPALMRQLERTWERSATSYK